MLLCSQMIADTLQSMHVADCYAVCGMMSDGCLWMLCGVATALLPVLTASQPAFFVAYCVLRVSLAARAVFQQLW